MIGDKPAFPATIKNQHPVSHMPGSEEKTPGMTLRQWYAGMAMQGDWANGVEGTWDNNVDQENLVRRAILYFRMADAMLEEGDNEKKEG
jgi:hypothetical protein